MLIFGPVYLSSVETTKTGRNYKLPFNKTNWGYLFYKISVEDKK